MPSRSPDGVMMLGMMNRSDCCAAAGAPPGGGRTRPALPALASHIPGSISELGALGAVPGQGEVEIEAPGPEAGGRPPAARESPFWPPGGRGPASGKAGPAGTRRSRRRRAKGAPYADVDDFAEASGDQSRQIASVGLGNGAHQAGRGQLSPAGPHPGDKCRGRGPQKLKGMPLRREATQAAVAGPLAQGAWMWSMRAVTKRRARMDPGQSRPARPPRRSPDCASGAAAPAAKMARPPAPSGGAGLPGPAAPSSQGGGSQMGNRRQAGASPVQPRPAGGARRGYKPRGPGPARTRVLTSSRIKVWEGSGNQRRI